MNFWITEVVSPADVHLFYTLPVKLFGHEPNFIAVPESMQDDIFNPERNKRMQYLRCKRWLLWKDGELLGRVAAFDHPKPASGEEAGAIGFFDCINNAEGAARLFEVAEKQLREWGAKLIDGPIQPGENDQYWGLLVEGFGKPSFGTNWQPPYYQSFYESAGFVPYYEQITNYIKLKDGLPERFFKIAAWVRQKGKVEIRHFQFANKKFFAQSAAHVYNHAWHMFDNFKPMLPEQMLQELGRLRQVLREDLVWFAYIGGEPAAFMLMLPDLNEIFEKTKSQLNLWGKWRFWWLNKLKRMRRLKIVVMGVHASYQKLGLESVLIEAAYDRVKAHYPSVEEVELAWVGDFNEPMKALHAAAGARPLRRHITFRKALDHSILIKKFEIKTD